MSVGRALIRRLNAATNGAGRQTIGRTLHTSYRAGSEADRRRDDGVGRKQQQQQDAQLPKSSRPIPPPPYSSSQSDDPRWFDEPEKAQDGAPKHRTQYNSDPFTLTPSAEHYGYPLVSPEWLAQQSVRPTSVRMLARDFIDDALYNPRYGYFSRHAVLLPDGDHRARSYDFANLTDEGAFAKAVEERYKQFEQALDERDKAVHAANKSRIEAKMKEVLQPLLKKEAHKEMVQKAREDEEAEQSASGSTGKKVRKIPAWSPRDALTKAQRKGRMDLARQLLNEQETGEHDRDVKAMAARQVWHTPTELFKPHYARAIARYMLERKKDGEALRVYEVGAGSGALASDILDYMQAEHPDVYAGMTYHIIEISSRLAEQQKEALHRHLGPRLQISNTSVFDWTRVETQPCFFLAMEVFDNLSHDVVRYDSETLQPYQALVSIDATGDMQELWEPARDPLITRYLNILRQRNPTRLPTVAPTWMGYVPDAFRRAAVQSIPFYPNMTEAHYVPTGSLRLLDVLARNFPQHRLVMSDFDQLPDSLPGRNAPVVQTRLNGTMIAVSKYTVHQGFFDIFFPTDFADLKHAHAHVVGEKDGEASQVLSHRAFLERYADVTQTTCKDGSNPMLSWYANASWFLSA